VKLAEVAKLTVPLSCKFPPARATHMLFRKAYLVINKQITICLHEMLLLVNFAKNLQRAAIMSIAIFRFVLRASMFLPYYIDLYIF
jgi:hypothetical protein